MRRLSVSVIVILAAVLVLSVGWTQLVPRPETRHVAALEEPVDTSLIGQIPVLGPEGEILPGGDHMPPEPPDRVTTVLIVGSDSREGLGNTGYGMFSGRRSDTVMLAQVNPYIGTTTVVSIPRDLWLRMPGCAGGGYSRFNSAFERGGLDCTVRLVRGLTGLRIHHVLSVDFNAFKQAVGVLGGVSVCVEKRLRDPKSGLDLPGGVSRLNPEQALAFARSRYSTADGSDISRIDRQQYLMRRVLAETRAQVDGPVEIWQMLQAVRPYLVVDQNFDVWAAAYLGADVLRSRLVTTTLPFDYSRQVPDGAVALDATGAAKVLQPLRRPVTEAPPAPPTPAPTPSASAGARPGIPCTA